MPFVLDCSMTMAWIFPDEANIKTAQLRESLSVDYALVPIHWAIEVSNVLLMAMRRKRIKASDIPNLISKIKALSLETDSSTAEHAFQQTLHLAQEHKLTSYDAAYLELALRRRFPLATLDKDLQKACKKKKVECIH